MAMAEYAWCSFNDNAKVIKMSSAGIAGRFHPTQKPEELYRWIYAHYTKPGFKILDTHLGSGSSRRAAYDFDLDFVGTEIDKEYFENRRRCGQNIQHSSGLSCDGNGAVMWSTGTAGSTALGAGIFGYYEGSRCCNYIFVQGEKRPCPPGKDCTERREKTKTGDGI